MHVPEIWDESEDFARNLVDWSMSVPPRPDQAKDLESVLLKNLCLKEKKCE